MSGAESSIETILSSIILPQSAIDSMLSSDTFRKKKFKNSRFKNNWETTPKKLYEKVLNNYQKFVGEELPTK